MDARFAVIYFVCITEYHCKCVDPWLLNNKRVCPVCKRKVIPGDSSDEEGNTGQPTQEPSESTPLLSPAHNLGGGPLENDLPVQGAPQMLVNIEFTSDDEYDADTEDAHENIGTNYDPEIVVVTSALSAPQPGSSSSYRTEENSQNYSPPRRISPAPPTIRPRRRSVTCRWYGWVIRRICRRPVCPLPMDERALAKFLLEKLDHRDRSMGLYFYQAIFDSS